MFNALFRKAQASVDNALAEVASRSMVAVPFLVAGGFAVAALAVRLHRTHDAETANLLMAALFAVFGLTVAAIEAVRQRRRRRRATAAEPIESAPPNAAETEPPPGLSAHDKELVLAALSSAAPMALPYVMRLALKNLPILAIVAAAGFILTRQPDADTEIVQPAE